jgi:hypothetical protein
MTTKKFKNPTCEDDTWGTPIDPGVRMRRRISFTTTNLTGSFQDDGHHEFKNRTCRALTYAVCAGLFGGDAAVDELKL